MIWLARTALRAVVGLAFGVVRVSAHETASQPGSADSVVQDADSDVTQMSPMNHVSPAPPQHAMKSMSGREMTDAMEMDDAAANATLRFDRLERTEGNGSVAGAWKLAATVGGDFDKLLIRSEGEHTRGDFERSDVEALWSHALASYWDMQVGARHDFGRGADRTWAAFGVQGLAPYWFEVGATAYVGDAGRVGLRVEVDYELSLTQRLILQPRVEIDAYGNDDPAARTGAGLSDAAFGLRLRYEIRREVAPYIGVEYSSLFAHSADFAREDNAGTRDTRWIVGLRLWY
jgi:copper resistance protein B